MYKSNNKLWPIHKSDNWSVIQKGNLNIIRRNKPTYDLHLVQFSVPKNILIKVVNEPAG